MKAYLGIMLCALAIGCGSGASDEGGPDAAAACGQSGRTGTTTCHENGQDATCQAGTYCELDASLVLYCSTGCTSDQNCGPNEYCAKCSGGTVGTCTACGTQACTTQTPTCSATNFAADTCTHDGLGSTGYECDDGATPTATSCQRDSSTPGIWCCGSVSNTCTPDNTANPECASFGLPPNAYDCPSNQRPIDSACEQSPGNPAHWCCP